MAKFYATKSFKAINDEWRKRLEESGFDDIESERGHLKQHNRRTIAFEHRDMISDFYSSLGEYLEAKRDIAETERKILELYAEGIRTKGKNGIAARVGKSDRWCRFVIKKYKAIILA